MQGVFLVLAAILGLSQVTCRLAEYSVPSCNAGGTLQNLNTETNTLNGMIMYDYAILCDGKVSSWEVFALRTGVIIASIWRINTATEGADRVQLVGKNRLYAEVTGYQEIEVPARDRIAVTAGDVIGVHYEDDDSNAVLSWESADLPRTTTKQLGVVQTLQPDLFNDQLTVGFITDKKPDETARLIPIKAQISSRTSLLRLVDGKTPREGRAEINHQGTWGTICDKWFDVRGWPFLFCLMMGYPEATHASYVTDATYVRDTSTAINMMSPRCKPSLNSTMFNCNIHPKGKCGHRMDLQLTCAPRVRLERGANEGEGVATLYEDGYWGTICDRKSPQWHLDNPTRSWVHVVCVELGYTTLKDVQLATEAIPNYHPSTPVAAFSPECQVSPPTRMMECPDGTVEYCDNDLDMYVTCQ